MGEIEFPYSKDLHFFGFYFFDSIHLTQQIFSHVGTGLRGFIWYKAEDKVSCSETQCSSSGEARNCNPLISRVYT